MPYINKVVYGSSTLIDLTADTVTPAALMQGYTAHDKSGAQVTGTLDASSGSAYQDADGYIVLGSGESSDPQGTLSVTANGTYDVTGFAGANVDVPVGMTETELKAYIQRVVTGIDWPDDLINIGPYAFARCSSFDTDGLPDTVTSIGEYAFDGCSSLSLTSLPSRLTVVNPYCFRNCTNLALSALPSGLTAINSWGFANCTSLALTSLPSSLRSIYSSAFRGCTSLALTILPSGLSILYEYSFYGCTSLALTSLPSSLTSVDNYVFQRCTSLQLSVLPNSIVKIGSSSFKECTGLTSISCEGTITTMGTSAFNGSETYPMQLASASFPNMAITSTLGTVFGSTTAASACQLLEFCDIGSTIGIAASAFANCYSLETLVLRKTASVCTLANVSAFLNTPMRGYNGLTGTVYVPSALISSYQTAANWSTLYNDGTVTFAAIEGSEYER